MHDLRMPDAGAPSPDPRKVRVGLAIITVVVAIAIVLFVILDDPVGRAVMFAIAVLGLVRAFLLSRSVRRS
jgi:hypothetical protein